MATIRYELLSKKKDGSYSVFLTITHKSVRRRLATGINLEKSDMSRGGKITSFDKLIEIEQTLNDYRERMQSICTSNLGRDFDVDWLVGQMTKSNKNETIDFFKFADGWLKSSETKAKYNYSTALRSFQDYLDSDTLDINTINYAMLKGYEISLAGKPRAQSMYLGLIRHLYREAIRTYNTDDVTLIKNDPFTRYQVPRQKKYSGSKRSLTLDELLRIYHYAADRPNSRAQQARDCFMLSFCLMGMNSADMFTAPKPHKGVVAYHRMKTMDRREDNAYIEVTIQPQVAELVKRYSDPSCLFYFHRKYSTYQCFNQNLNIGLKEVGAAVGIADLQFYQARHTFATLSRNLMRFSKGDVDEALNHVGDYSIADVYIKKDFSIINDNNRKLLDRVFGEMVL